MTPLEAMRAELTDVPGQVSVWYGQPGAPASFALAEHAPHYAASTMKLAVLAGLYRSADAGLLRLDADVLVRNEFASAAPGAPSFACRRDYDSDEAVWECLGDRVPLRWLAERMIIRSSNLATNLVLAWVGLPAVAEVWPVVGAGTSVVARGIEDSAAAAAGLTNLVSAADLAALLGTITLGAHATAAAALGPLPTTGGTSADLHGTITTDATSAGPPHALASPASCTAMIETLLAQEWRVDLAVGLPAGTRVAHKNGWVTGVRHSAGIVFPDDAEPFVLAVCLTTPLATGESDDTACGLIARIATAAWANAHAAA